MDDIAQQFLGVCLSILVNRASGVSQFNHDLRRIGSQPQFFEMFIRPKETFGSCDPQQLITTTFTTTNLVKEGGNALPVSTRDLQDVTQP